MCNLYHMAPRDHVERYFRAMVPVYGAVPVGPFGMGLFLRPIDGRLQGVMGQWGMIPPKARAHRPDSRAILTNNARSKTAASRPTYRAAWAAGQRCLIPADWYQEPNWETGRNVWWRMARADGEPWAIAGLWSAWTDPATGEIVPNFTMLTVNCDGHLLFGRLHKLGPKLPADAQDKRSVVPLEPDQWPAWFEATPAFIDLLLRHLDRLGISIGEAEGSLDGLDQHLSLSLEAQPGQAARPGCGVHACTGRPVIRRRPAKPRWPHARRPGR